MNLVRFTRPLTLGLLLVAAVAAEAQAEGARARWFDLLTRDAEAVGKFYGPLFDWKFIPSPNGGWTAQHNGATVAGVSQLETTAPGVGHQTWIVGFQIDDLDRALADTTSAGGAILQPTSVATGFGRWAVVADPQGAPLLLFSADTKIGGEPTANSFFWVELWTRDPTASVDFYRKVLGWDLHSEDLGGRPYTYFVADGEPRAGVAQLERGELEAAWATYIAVDDLEAKLDRVRELGGRVLQEPRPDFAAGRAAVIEDPNGVDFFLWQLGSAP